MAKEYKEIGGRIYIREDGRYSGSRPLAGRVGAVTVGDVISPTLDRESLTSGWRSSIEEARENYLTHLSAESLLDSSFTESGALSVAPFLTVGRPQGIIDAVVSDARPTLLPHDNRVLVGFKGRLSVYLRTDGRLALSKPLFELGADGQEFPIMNGDTGKLKYKLTEVSASDYDVYAGDAVRAAQAAWDNSEAVYPAGTIIPKRVEIAPSNDFYNANDIVNDTLRTLSEDYGRHILDTDGTVRLYFVTDESGESVPNEYAMIDSDEEDYRFNVQYSVIGNINDPKVRALYSGAGLAKTLDERINKVWDELSRDPLGVRSPNFSYLSNASESFE